VSPDNKNNWRCAIAEAAFMTGLERNADLIHMASYAPLFAHTEGWQWTPNLIWFDNLRSYGTPNYYVQQLFSTNKGSVVLPISYQGAAPAGQDGLYASSVYDAAAKEVVVKVVNTTATSKQTEIRLNASKKAGKTAKGQVISSKNPDAMNSLDQPKAIGPQATTVEVKNGKLTVNLEPHSVSVYLIPY